MNSKVEANELFKRKPNNMAGPSMASFNMLNAAQYASTGNFPDNSYVPAGLLNMVKSVHPPRQRPSV